jgi:hypothetical protein
MPPATDSVLCRRLGLDRRHPRPHPRSGSAVTWRSGLSWALASAGSSVVQRDCPVSGLRRGGVRLLPYQPIPAAALLKKEDGEASIRPQRIGTSAGTRDPSRRPRILRWSGTIRSWRHSRGPVASSFDPLAGAGCPFGATPTRQRCAQPPGHVSASSSARRRFEREQRPRAGARRRGLRTGCPRA